VVVLLTAAAAAAAIDWRVDGGRWPWASFASNVVKAVASMFVLVSSLGLLLEVQKRKWYERMQYYVFKSYRVQVNLSLQFLGSSTSPLQQCGVLPSRRLASKRPRDGSRVE